jgi:hypothetical protein
MSEHDIETGRSFSLEAEKLPDGRWAITGFPTKADAELLLKQLLQQTTEFLDQLAAADRRN